MGKTPREIISWCIWKHNNQMTGQNTQADIDKIMDREVYPKALVQLEEYYKPLEPIDEKALAEFIIKEFHLDMIEKDMDKITNQLIDKQVLNNPHTATEMMMYKNRKSDMRYRVRELAHAIATKFGIPKYSVPTEAKDLLKRLSKKVKDMLAIMKKHNIVIDNLDDKMQKFAFTLYSELVQLSSEADNLITKP